MLVLQDWNYKKIHIPNYTWDAGIDCFKCELKDVDIVLIAEAVKGGRDSSWVSTSPSNVHSVDIMIYEDNPLVGGQDAFKFKCFTWETWDAEGYNVKITGRVWGEPNTWKGYEDYVRS